MAAAHVQTAHVAVTTGQIPSRALAYGSNVTAGNTLVVCVIIYGSPALGTGTVTDSQGNAYTRLVTGTATDSNTKVGLFAAVAGSSAACTVTATPQTGNSYMSMTASEYSGLSGVTLFGTGVTVNGTTANPVTPNMTATGTTLVAGCLSHGSSTRTMTAGASFAERAKYEATDAIVYHLEDRGAASVLGAGTYAASWTMTAGAIWVACAAAFQVAGAGPVKKPTPYYMQQRQR